MIPNTLQTLQDPSYTVYTRTVCGYSYSEQNATETTYDAASALEEGESYVIVASNYALTYGSSADKTSVTVSDGTIASDISDAMIWTYENGMLSNSSSSVSFSSSRVKVGSYYLRYSSGAIKASRSSSTAYLFEQTEA